MKQTLSDWRVLDFNQKEKLQDRQDAGKPRTPEILSFFYPAHPAARILRAYPAYPVASLFLSRENFVQYREQMQRRFL